MVQLDLHLAQGIFVKLSRSTIQQFYERINNNLIKLHAERRRKRWVNCLSVKDEFCGQTKAENEKARLDAGPTLRRHGANFE